MYAYYCKICNYFQFGTPRSEKEQGELCNCCYKDML